MNKIVIIVAALLFVAIGGVGTYIIFTADPSVDTTSPTSTPSVDRDQTATITPVIACDILTKDIAESVLGKDIDHSSGAPTDSISEDIKTTTCSYITKFNTEAKTKEEVLKSSGITLTVQSAKTEAGIANLRKLYDAFPNKTEKITGIGDEAFYSTSFRQLHVLKGGNWYVIMYFKDTITNSSLASNKLVAQKLNFK